MQQSVNQRIKFFRFSLGINQGEFAQAVNIPQGSISRYEVEGSTIPVEIITSIIKTYNLNPNWLLFGEGEMQSSNQVQSQSQSQFTPPPGYVLMAMEDLVKYITPQKTTSDEK